MHRRKAPLFRRKTVVRRASCGLQHRTAGFRVARARAPLRRMSLGSWQNTQTCRAGVPCRADRDRFTRHGRALHRREASPLQRKTVVRRGSCYHQRIAGIRVARVQAPLRQLSLGLGRLQNTHACRPCAPCCAGYEQPAPYGKGTAPTEGRSLSVLDRGATCEMWPPTCSPHLRGMLTSATALAVSREVANTRACRARVPFRADRDRCTWYQRACTGGRLLSFRARPWCDVRAMASNVQPAFAWHAHQRHCAGYLSGGCDIRELAARSRRATLVLVVLRPMDWHCTSGRPLPFGARPWCDARAVASNMEPAFTWHPYQRHCAGCLSGVEKRRKLAARAHRAALVVIGICDIKNTAPAEDLFLSVQDRGATCEL